VRLYVVIHLLSTSEVNLNKKRLLISLEDVSIRFLDAVPKLVSELQLPVVEAIND
jgi:hypothetical protein